jgi:integrase
MTERKRRGHNEGSIFYMESRNRWVVDVSLGPGKRKRFYCKTKQEAVRKKNEVLREVEQNALATGPRRKLGEYLEDWLENVHKDKVRVSTYVKYKKTLKYITDDLGEIWLQKLTPEQVRRFYTRMGKKPEDGGRGLSSKSIHEIHGVLHLALKNAVRWGYVSRNVCDLVEPPRIVSREAAPLTLEQAQILLKSVSEHRLEVLLTMAVVTGMRRGELLALRWANVDFERKTLLVLHTVDYIPKYGYVETEPKTAAGKRLISLPAFLVEMLKQHRVKLLEQQLKQGSAWEDRDLVFPDLHGGYFNPGYLIRLFTRLLREAGVPHMHFHDLRHSAATILLSMGVNMKVIQELLGHSDISITLGLYSHLLPTMQQAVVEKWDGVFGRQDKKHNEETS